MGSSFVDEIDSGSNFFDQIDDLIKFPSDVEYLAGSGDSADIPAMWNAPFPDADDVFSGNNVLAELSVPYEDIVQLEWLSTFVEDSFSSRGMTIGKDDSLCTKKDISIHQFQTSSPVSVLESTSNNTSSSRNSNCICISTLSPPLSPSPNPSHQRARSKRPRPATFNPRTGIQLIPSFIQTPRPFMIEKPENHEPHKKKIKIRAAEKLSSDTLSSPPKMIRKCMHCEITKTPQWRAGPMGQKTLCNACGVRYKSGRLFPEYRPAASPTFSPSLHSNSHKKVIQMRSKALDATTPTSTAAVSSKPI